MKTTLATTTRRPDNGQLSFLLTGAFAAGVMMLASGLFAQNNDNGGILPGMPGGQSKASESSSDSNLAVDGQMEGTEVDAAAAVLSITSDGDAAVGMALGVSPDDAEFHLTGALFAEQQPDGGLQVQGSGTLNPEIGLHLRLMAASFAVARGVILVGDSGQGSLEDLLNGYVSPFAAVALGDMPSLDLGVFNKMLQKHAGQGAAFRATFVFLSVDSTGTLHMAAVSGRPDGSPLELAFN